VDALFGTLVLKGHGRRISPALLRGYGLGLPPSLPKAQIMKEINPTEGGGSTRVNIEFGPTLVDRQRCAHAPRICAETNTKRHKNISRKKGNNFPIGCSDNFCLWDILSFLTPVISAACVCRCNYRSPRVLRHGRSNLSAHIHR